MVRKAGTAAFLSQGRAGHSTTNFLNRRPRSVACVWADGVAAQWRPPYQDLTGVPNELLLTRPPSGISRFQSSVRKGVYSYAEVPDPPPLRPSTSMGIRTDSLSLSRPESRADSRLSMAVGDESPLRMFKARRRLSAEAAAQPEATRSKAANELASELQAPNVPYRATSSMSGSQADIAELERPDSYTPVSSMAAADQSHNRPAGLSRTPAGKYLGLNINPSGGPPSQQGPDRNMDKDNGDSLQIGGETQSQRRLRWAPTEPNYLFKLQRYALTSGCTKYVPGRRFVDFVSRNDAYLLADHQRRADEKFHPKSNKLHFSRTSRSVEPGGHEPYVMQTVYAAGGTSYHEFNDLRTVAR